MLSFDRKTATLPSFGRLAGVAFAVNAPFLAYFLLERNLRVAASMLGGYGLALVIYGLLHAIVGRGLDFFTPEPGARPDQSGKTVSALGFVALMMGKYVLVAAFLFALWRTEYFEVIPFLGGFLLAQIAVTWLSASKPKKAS